MSWHSRSSLGNIDPTREHERGRRRTRSQPRRSSTPSTTAATGYIITGEPVTASANEISPERRSHSPIIPALPEVDPYNGYPTVIPPAMTYSAPVFYPPQPATRDTYTTVEPEGPEDRYHTRDPWSRRRSRSSQPSHRPRRDSADRLFGSGQGWPLGTPQVPAGASGSTAHLPSRPAYMGYAYPDAARPAQYPFNPPVSANMPYPGYSMGSIPQPDFRFGQKSTVFGSDATSEILYFFLYTVPKEIYLIALFRLPQFYFSRVKKVFDDAELSKRDIHKIYQTTAREWRKSRDKKREEDLPPISWNVNANNGDNQITPAMMSFKASWEDFIDSLQREWSTLNLLSGLLLTAILTLLTLDGAPDDPVTRTASVISLICALMSILYACLYIARFGPMRQMYKAASWAEEARRTRTNIVWNVWALLAMPAVWLAWSLISFIVAIMSYVWRTNSESSPSPRTTSDGTALAIRIATTCVLGVGVLYFALVLRTFGQYGDAMDRQWEEDNDRRMRLLNGLRSSSYHIPDTEKHTYRPYPPYPPVPPPADYPPFASPVIIHDSRMASTEDAGPLASGAQIRSSIDSRSSQQRRRRRLGGTTPERGSTAVDEQESGRLPRARSSRHRGSSEYYGRSHGRPTSSSAERSVRIASTPEFVPDVKHSARQARGAAAYVDPLPFPLSTIQEESTVESSSSLGYHQRPLSRPIDREDQVLAWRPFRAYPLVDLDTLDSEDAGRNIRFVPRAPSAVYDRGLAASTWTYFIEDLKKAWFYRHSAEESRYHSPTATVLATLARWEYFFRRCYEITVVLVERTTETDLKRYRICVFDSQYDVTRAFDGYFEMNPSETDPKVVVLDGPPPWDEAFRRQRTFINPRTAQYASSTRRGREHPDPPSGGMHIRQSPTGFSYYEQTERPLSESPTERSPLFSGVESPRAGSSQHVIERRSSASSNPNTRTQSPALPAATPHVNLNMDDEQGRMQDSEAS